jgi:tetratricopeptide (TPR) repeat protein
MSPGFRGSRAALAVTPRGWARCGLLLALTFGQASGLLAQALPAELAADTAPTLAELHALTVELASADAALRTRAFASLRTLDAEALPALRARMAELRSRGFDGDGALSGMSEFRRIQGVEAPDGAVDLAQGVLPALAKNRAAGVVLAAELVAYLRALEAQKTPDAGALIVGELFALDGKLFRYEAPRTRERLSILLIPALIRHRTHRQPWIRRFVEDSLLELHIDSPGRAVQQDDVVLLAGILDAYGDTLTFDAMPVVVSYVTDERVAVRDAARRAVQRFGKNAIWQLRERYVNATGREADANWSFQRTLDELIRLHEGPGHAAFLGQLKDAQAALEAGDTQKAEGLLDAALRDHPHERDTAGMATAYARIGGGWLEQGALGPALRDYRRALRLAPEGADAAGLRARVVYLEAQQRLAQGTVDLKAYEQALALDPGFTRAQDALDELSGARAAHEQRVRRSLGLVAALLLLGAGVLALRRKRDDPREEPAEA